ncbi:MAG TPA: formate/nitrite transporter family protein [Acidimicrobiales bacterium]|nr:formate/nitrite transporter family protein [Acidimicrobiales bacterium]
MPVPISDALADAGAAAATKAAQVRGLPRYLALSAFAGAFVGVAVVLLLVVSAPFAAASSPLTKLVQGGVFGIALTLVVFAGAELFTGNAMTMVQGLAGRAVRVRDVASVWAASLVGNLIGSLGFAAAVGAAGTLAAGAKPGAKAPAQTLLAAMLAAKAGATGAQLFWRAVLCNLLVCLALWMAARTKSDAAKLVVLWWALLAFVASGFEHSIANMTIFGLGITQGLATWSDLARNLLYTVPGNVVGGGLLVGLAYAWIGRPVSVRTGRTIVLTEPAAPAEVVVDPAVA